MDTGAEKQRRLLMISLDAVSSDDMQILQEFPNFSALCERGTLVRNVDSVMVSNTYPAHTSIITGVHPHKHGIIDNLFHSSKQKKVSWRYHVRDIQVPTLYEKASEQGMKVCSILYPVTGGANILYNFPEIAGDMHMFERLWKLFTTGSTRFLLANLVRFCRHFKGMQQPELDDFTTLLAADAWKRYHPELLLLHLIDVDSQKHHYGPAHEQAREAIKRHDIRLGKLIDVLRESNTYDQTGIIVFSDHGCRPVHTAVEPNEFLSENQYSTLASFHNAGGTTYLRVEDGSVAQIADQLITEFLHQPYISRKLTEAEMYISGMDGEYIAGFEAAEGYCFGDSYKGQHGYGVDHGGDSPFYLAVGAGIEQGKELTGGCIVDICPLAADMLGIGKWQMDGINRVHLKSERDSV